MLWNTSGSAIVTGKAVRRDPRALTALSERERESGVGARVTCSSEDSVLGVASGDKVCDVSSRHGPADVVSVSWGMQSRSRQLDAVRTAGPITKEISRWSQRVVPERSPEKFG